MRNEKRCWFLRPVCSLVKAGRGFVQAAILIGSVLLFFTRAGVISRAMDKSNGWFDFVFGVALITFALYLFRSEL